MSYVELHHLSKSYNGRFRAVNDISLQIPSGKITALLGPSGCGKTTILKMIAGLLPPTNGDITFDGASVLHIPAESRGAVMVFQNHLLFPYMSVGENVGFGLKMHGVDKTSIKRRVSEMLELVKLSGYESRRPHELSGGQQQRVALARALIVQPAVLLLDEPLSNLDAHLKDEMRGLILQVQQQLQTTMLVVTHDQQTAVILADQVALLFEGVLHQVGHPHDFYERPSSAQVARFFGGANFLPGRKEGEMLHTGWGSWPVCSPLPDGPVLLTIRPEQVQIEENGRTGLGGVPPELKARPGLVATILSHVYLGTHTRLKLKSGDLCVEAISHTSETRHLCPGDTVILYLPPEKIWLLPAES